MNTYEKDLLSHIKNLKTLNHSIICKFNNLPYHKMYLENFPEKNGWITLIIEDNFLSQINKIFKSKIFNKIKTLKKETLTIDHDKTKSIYTIIFKMTEENLNFLWPLIYDYQNKVYANSALELQKELNNRMTMDVINSILKKQKYGNFNTLTNELTMKKWLKFDFLKDIIDHFINTDISYSIRYTKGDCILQTNDTKGIEYIKTYFQIKLLQYTDFDELKFFILSKGWLSV